MATAVNKTNQSVQQEQNRKRWQFTSVLAEIGKYALLIPLAISFVFPLYWMLISGLKNDPQVFQVPPTLIPNPAFWNNFVEAWTILPFNTFTYNSIFRYSLPVTIITVISSTIVAYGFSKIKWPGRDKLFWVVLATMMLPWAVKMVPLFLTFKTLDWLDTYNPWVVPALFGSPYYIFLLRQFFRTIPEDLSEAARIDGASELTILFRILIPLARPALTVVALFTFMATWNDYLGPKIFLQHQENYPLALGIELLDNMSNSVGNTPNAIPYLMAASSVVTLPMVILFFLAQRTFIEGISLTGTKG
ncbi:MAG: carbohydrate ABC transporter permease [Ardenticatenaceae bacterium]|nr:carbohydrate ABC transporter permease [Ardenticatenaceae bacterium]MCB8946752.1 carbohydrate ABC transporter permease [Ardenticatenaceae bacterium]